MTEQQLEDLSLDQLLEEAKTRRIGNASDLSRRDLISAILAWDNI